MGGETVERRCRHLALSGQGGGVVYCPVCRLHSLVVPYCVSLGLRV